MIANEITFPLFIYDFCIFGKIDAFNCQLSTLKCIFLMLVLLLSLTIFEGLLLLNTVSFVLISSSTYDKSFWWFLWSLAPFKEYSSENWITPVSSNAIKCPVCMPQKTKEETLLSQQTLWCYRQNNNVLQSRFCFDLIFILFCYKSS
jgi:hypothetical protein